MRACNCARASPFQSRTCEGCDGKSNCGKTALRWFQSTHPRGVRPLLLMIRSSDTSFNPRTRVGCDCFLRIQTTYMLVSIHAPAWGATVAKTSILVGEMAFQSTHPRGVRPPAKTWRHPHPASFNPRTRVGCDKAIQTGLDVLREFQSTHPRGVRLPDAPASEPDEKFQSTHPRGVRLYNVQRTTGA